MNPGQSFDIKAFTNAIFQINDDQEFNALAMELFHYQYRNNLFYQSFCDLLKHSPAFVKSFSDVPFLPIEFFRDHPVTTGTIPSDHLVFTSSGTTGSLPSKHILPDISLYEKSFIHSFTHFYGDPTDYCLLALLPGYLERPGSSLAYMMEYLIRITSENGSGFYLHDLHGLAEKILEVKSRGRKIILFGVSFALLDFAEQYPMDLSDVIVMETGGMKGRREEMVRDKLHGILCQAFQVDRIHSEYGMTEMLTQAYSSGGGIFKAPPWLKLLTRDIHDPLAVTRPGDTGGINVVDLANIHSCSFIATQDLGRMHEDGSFEVLGRFDSSDIRGCNLLVT